MNANRVLVILIFLSLTFSLSACKLSLPAPEVATPTAGEASVVTPEATNVIDALYLIASQTAMAGQTTPVVPIEVTPVMMDQTPTVELLVTEEPPPMETAPLASPVGPQPTIVVPSTYTLNKGEHPYCLGRRFDVNPGDILNANGLSANTVFRPGMVLQIPQTGRAFPGNRVLHPHPTSYTVKSGDTIYSIACYFGDLDPMMIAWANNLVEPFSITAGQVLNIP